MIRKTTLEIGIAKPVRMLLTGDNHLSYADEREGTREREHSEIRNRDFFSKGNGADNLRNELLNLTGYAKKECDLLAMVGDVMDHPAALNREIFADSVAGMRQVYAVGNHDYNNYSVEKESPELLHNRTAMLEETLGYKPYNNSLQYGGVNFVCLEDVFYGFSADTLEYLKSQVTKGLPTILFFHIPLYAETLLKPITDYWNAPIMCGCPDSVRDIWGEKTPKVDGSTKETLELIADDDNIKAVCAGHVHFAHEDILPCGKPQIICEAGYLGGATEITLV